MDFARSRLPSRTGRWPAAPLSWGRRLTAPSLPVLVVLLAALATPTEAAAAARSEVTVDGGRVIVEGGSAQSVASTAGGHVIDVDGLKIRVEPEQITVGGQTRPLPEYEELRVKVEGGVVTLTVDGKRL